MLYIHARLLRFGKQIQFWPEGNVAAALSHGISRERKDMDSSRTNYKLQDRVKYWYSLRPYWIVISEARNDTFRILACHFFWIQRYLDKNTLKIALAHF